MTSSARLSILVILVAACNFPRPPDLPEDAAPRGDASSRDAAPGVDAPPDAPDPPGSVIRVAPTGDDANDGMTQPVKTLKHAIGLAAANGQITKIVLASGRYATAGGETFPYTVPANVVIIGPAGGGAILAGSQAEPGMTVGAGTLQDLELEDFTVAITATGLASVKNIHIRTSTIALRGETTAKLTLSNIDIAGESAACPTGIELNGNADMVVTGLSTRGLGSHVLVKDQSSATITGATATGVVTCQVVMFSIASSTLFAMRDSLIDTGYVGMSIRAAATAAPTQATLTNVTIRNMDGGALGGGNAVVQVTGGALSSGPRGTSFSIIGGVWSLSNVALQNSQSAIYVQQATLTMRDCMISDNSIGIDLSVGAVVDFGTASSPGGNVIKNSLMGLVVEGAIGRSGIVDAVGNTWKPLQGAGTDGKYAAHTVFHGPVAEVSGNNFELQGSDETLNL